LSGKEAGRMTVISALLTEILIRLARQGAPGASEASWAKSRDGERIELLDELIDVHLREHRPIAFYARRLGISPTHLNRLCRLHLGESARAAVDRKLVSGAKRELMFSRFPVQAIALSLGFSDPAYFNRFFRKKTGLTPGRYRATQRREPTP
jgi:AraC family transcriptional activator of pobA